MKKLFGLILITGLFFLSCENDDSNNDSETEKTTTAQITSWADDWDSYSYSYDNEGRVIKIDRNNGEREYNLSYTEGTISISGYATYTIVLGSNGYASSFSDEWDTYQYTYDSEGYMTKIEKEDDIVSNIIVENGCISSWSKFEDGVEFVKNHTYSSAENVAGINNIYSEKGGFDRWLAELGFFGKPTKYLCSGNQWDYSESGSQITYEYDENGFVLKEVKNFPADDWTENYSYTWNIIEE